MQSISGCTAFCLVMVRHSVLILGRKPFPSKHLHQHIVGHLPREVSRVDLADVMIHVDEAMH
jgi:hypothetical protein